MKQRFIDEKKHTPAAGILISVFLMIAVLGFFSAATGSVADKTSSLAKTTLEQAIGRDIARCYAATGQYPESLEVLKQTYGLTYDENRFFVDYHPQGANLVPDFVIIDREVKP